MAERENVESVTGSIESFATQFHKDVAGKNEGNLVCSALSAHLVLSMAAYGAEGNTAKEMRQVLRLPDDDAQAHQAFCSFIQTLNNIPNVILKVANKIYTSETIGIKEKFVKLTGKYFHSESEVVDFAKSSEAAKAINQWCVDKTNGKIREIIANSDVNADTGLVLLNAVYFKGHWKNKFDESLTESKPFHINKEITIQVPMMLIKNKFFYKYLEEFNAECIGLPYENEDIVMFIIVPKEIDGLKDLQDNLEKIDLNSENDHKVQIQLSLPKFKVETTIDLNQHLSNLGLNEMFSNNANFKGISDQPLKVDKVLQKAFIEVNEEGCEAAAVTGIRIMKRSLCLPYELQVDRPFVYRIIDTKNNVTLFSGHIVEPKTAQCF